MKSNKNRGNRNRESLCRWSCIQVGTALNEMSEYCNRVTAVAGVGIRVLPAKQYIDSEILGTLNGGPGNANSGGG